MESLLVIFDLDWTLACPQSANKFRSPGEPYSWLLGRKELLEALHADGCAIAVATNQGGIGAGHLEYGETQAAIHALLSQLPFSVPWVMCPYFAPYDGSESEWQDYKFWRKPAPGMLLALMNLYPRFSSAGVLCVGDRKEDALAAEYAGLAYEDIEAFAARKAEELGLDVASETDIPF